MPEELYLLVVVKNVDNVFDEREASNAFRVVGAFMDLDEARLYAPAIADFHNHGDRVCIFGFQASASLGLSEVLVIVEEGIN